MENKNNEDFIGGGMMANTSASSFDEFAKEERERIFIDELKIKNEIKKVAFDAFRNEKVVTLKEYGSFITVEKEDKLSFERAIIPRTGYIYDCLLNNDGASLIIFGELGRTFKRLIKISDVESVRILTDEEIKERGLDVTNYPISYGEPFKCNPHHKEGFMPYEPALNKFGVRIAVPLDYKGLDDDKDFKFFELTGDNFKRSLKDDCSIINALYQEFNRVFCWYFTKEELVDNKGKKIAIGVVDANEVPGLITKLTLDLGELRFQILKLEDYTKNIQEILVDALSNENYEDALYNSVPYPIPDDDEDEYED